jgi:hypothetical protein
MPDCAGLYLVDFLFDIGPVMSYGNGFAEITHMEVAAWQRLSGIELQPWESRMLRMLSLQYLNELLLAVDHQRRMPWEHAPDIYIRARNLLTAKTLKESFKDIK